MADEDRFLQRLKHPSPQRQAKQDVNALADSVLSHLRLMLNSWHGHALIQDDYGIPNLADLMHNFPGSIGQMEEGIRNTLEQYEPRLLRIRVKYIPNEDDLLELRFEITAQLKTRDERASVWFETAMDSNGQLSVRG